MGAGAGWGPGEAPGAVVNYLLISPLGPADKPLCPGTGTESRPSQSRATLTGRGTR